MIFNNLSSYEDILNKIESILLNKCKNLNKPLLSHDLSFLLFEASFYKYSKEIKHKEICLNLLNDLLDSFDQIEYATGGFTESFEGVLWLFVYLKKCNIIDDDEYYKDLMPYLHDSIDLDLQSNNFDLLHGVLNKIQTLINFYDGNNNTIVEGYVDLFIEKIYKTRIEKDNCIFWYNEIYDDGSRAINLGFAHGLPSLLVFLLKLKSNGYNDHKISLLIDGIINSLLSFSYKNSYDCFIPDIFHEDISKNKYDSSRLAFCYGDLGIAFSFLLAYKVLGRNDLYNLSEKIIYRVCKRTMTTSGILHYNDYHFFDTSFCHGISGILFILTRINKMIKKEYLTKTIKYWNDELIYNLNIQLNIKGEIKFPFWMQPNDGQPYIIDDECILTGYSGTALILLSLIYEKDDWSEIFLLDTLS